jgi:hypothetical protein
VLQELNVWLNNSTANQEQQKHLILTTPLQQRLAAGACRLYHLLPKAATAAGHATSPVVLTLLADGLQLAMRLPQLYLWPFLDMVPRQLRIIAWSAERQQALKPELATLCWQQLVQNKVRPTGLLLRLNVMSGFGVCQAHLQPSWLCVSACCCVSSVLQCLQFGGCQMTRDHRCDQGAAA